MERTSDFFSRHGGKAITLAQFVPIVRTFAPFVAGMGHMHYRRFLRYNVLAASPGSCSSLMRAMPSVSIRWSNRT